MKKTMEMMFKENKENTREKIQAKKRALKRHQIKENILFTIIAIFILTITCLLLNSLNENSYKNCMEKNNNDNFCQAVYE